MRFFPSFLIAAALSFPLSLAAQTQTQSRIAPYANLTPQTQLTGHLPLWANTATDTGQAATTTTVTLTFLLARTSALQTAFDQLTDDQQNPATSRFHQWLTPSQIGDQYGPTLAEVASITRWITSQGLQVTAVSPSRTFIEATGPASAASAALSTALHLFNVDGQTRLAPTTEPSIPTAFATVIRSIEGLTDTPFRAYNAVRPAFPEADTLHPQATKASGAHYLFPGDFARIYDIVPTTSAGYDGSGIKIAIAGQSRIADTDVTELQTMAGLPAKLPNTILVPTSADPGLVKGDQDESTLDAIRILTTATGVQADLVIAASPSGGVSASIQYAINTLVDPILSISYGACEASASASSVQFYNLLFQQAAAEGISTFVSSGDSAAAGCSRAFSTPTGTETLGMGNYLCSSTYVTCLGGTLFSDTGLDATYWSPTNTPTYTSALGYIPEGAWNEPTAVGSPSTYVIAGTGSGPSAYISKPSWQIPANTPQDGARDIPDLAFSAANHDGYFACLAYIGTAGDCAKGGGVIFSGTSATAPAMAAIAALLNQRLGKSQGNLNPLLYRLALSNPSAFHDATPATSGVATCSTATPSPCNNSTPGKSTLTGGLAGYPLQVGYDMVTGLGSLDVTNFLNAAVNPTQPAAVPPASTTTTLTASTATLVVGQTATFTATVQPAATGTPTGTVQFFSNKTALTAALPIAGGAVTTPATTFPTAGTFAITAVYAGDTTNATSTSAAVTLTVSSPPTVTLAIATPGTILIGQSTTYSANVTPALTSTSSPTGTIQFALNGTPVGGAIALASGRATLTATPTAAGTFTLTATYSGDIANAASTSSPATLTVTSLPATLTAIAVTPSTTTVGQATVYSATVTPAAYSATLPTGSIQFALDGAPVNAPVALVSGKASMTAIPTVAGTFILTAAYLGNTSYAPSASAPASLVVNAMPTAVTLTASSTFLSAGDPATLTAAVTAAPGTTPTGTVQFFAGTVSLGTSTLSGAIANLTAVYPTAGTYALTAVYSGNSSLGASTSSPTTLTVAPITAAASLTVSANPANVTLASSATTPTTGTVVLATPDSFTGTVTLVCTVVPVSGNSAVPPTCTLPASTIAFNSAQTATAIITLSATSSRDQHNVGPIARLSARPATGSPCSPAAPLGGISLATLVLIAPAARRRNLRRLLAALPIVFLATLLPLTGCGSSVAGSSTPSGGSGAPAITTATPGTYTVTLIAATGAISATTTLTVTVN